MALQAIDRKNAKHALKTAPRFQPPMVRRSNKLVLKDHAPRHIVTAIDPSVTYFGDRRYFINDAFETAMRDWPF